MQRLELAKLSELWGKAPWAVISNEAYEQRQVASVSVVITLYNYAAYIHKCLDSVCASDASGLPDGFEILVINDCSTDNSAQLVRDYFDKHSDIPISLVNKQFNTGLADSRNLGLKLARAPYVFILDADNWIHFDCITRLYQAIQGSAAAYGMIRRFNHDSGEEVNLISNREWNVYELVCCPYIDAMAMFDRQILLSLSGYSSELIHYGWFGWEDYDLWLKLAQSGHECRFVPEVLSEYRVHSSSMLSTTNLYADTLVDYFKQKFKPLVERYEDFDLLFGQPLERPPTLETQQAEQIQQLQTQIQQLQTQQQAHIQQLQTQQQMQIQQLQEQLQASQTKLKQAESTSKERLTLIHQLQRQLQEAQAQLQQERRQLQQRLQQTESELQFRDLELQFATTGRDQYLGRLQAIESSKFWQLRTQWQLLKNQLLGGKESPFWQPEIPYPKPIQPEPVKLAEPKPIKRSTEATYERWQQQNEPRPSDYQRMRETLKLMPFQPLISVIVPTYNTPETFLREAIDSVINQLYPNWELCIADDASSEPHVREILEEYSAKDQRIKVVFRTENGHISRCSNSALELATGEYISLLDHDDLMRPEALYEVIFLLNRHPEADMIYSDEDKIDEIGNRCHPFFKPDWCPDSFLSRMYTCHLGTYRRSIINDIGGFRTGYEGSQDYDLVLRFTEKTDQIFHIPKILYHWRIHQQSAASGTDAKPYAYIAAKKAVGDALRRRGEPGRLQDVPEYVGYFNVRYQIKNYQRVSIIIPSRDLGHDLNQCLKSIFTKSSYPNYEVVLIDNGSSEPDALEVIQLWQAQEPERFRCYSLDIPFNYSKLNNYGVSQATGEYLLFLNNDTEVITPDWIEGMVEQAQRNSIGAVGAKLLYPDDTIQHAGVAMGIGGVAGHLLSQVPGSSSAYFCQLMIVNNYTAITGACLMCRRDVFDKVGGFNEIELAVAFNDIDFCLRVISQGFRIVLPPHVKLYHHESKSRGLEDTAEKLARFHKEVQYMHDHWQNFIDYDPCYNPNFTRRRTDCSLNVDE
jgi:glycosyltransferase involved in cell wall biosynthesis